MKYVEDISATLISATDKFFSRHWPSDVFGIPPKWSESWGFVGSIPNVGNAGCYALFSNEKLLYIGLSEDTIANRTAAYTRVARGGLSIPTENRPYVPSEGWSDKGLTHIVTIGFPEEARYLAPALEVYLIKALRPPENILGK